MTRIRELDYICTIINQKSVLRDTFLLKSIKMKQETINVNGVDVPMQSYAMAVAKHHFKILSLGMTMKGVTMTKLKKMLKDNYGIVLNGKTNLECYNEIKSILR